MSFKGKFRSRHFVFDKTENHKEIPRGLAGCAFKYDNEDYFRLKLNVFENRDLYIVPNRTHRLGPAYWILSRRNQQPTNSFVKHVHFQVGYASKSKTANSLILHIYDLNRTYELYLEPEDFHYNKLAIAA